MRAGKARRILALVLCALLLAVWIAAALFVAANAYHPHRFGESRRACPLCRQVKIAQAILQAGGLGLIAAVLRGGAALWRREKFFAAAGEYCPASLIRLKIRLNN